MSSAPQAVHRLIAGAAAAFLLAFLSFAATPAVAGADAPSRLPGQITDTVGALDSDQLDDVQNAIDQLYADHKVRLWVAYVTDFGDLSEEAWATQTAEMSSLGDRDVLLSVATVDRAYYLSTSSALKDVSSSEAESIRVDAVEPALREEDWADAAISTAGGLDDAMSSSGGMSTTTLLVGGGVVAAGAGGLALYSRKRRTDRTKAGARAAKNIDPNDTPALAALDLPTLDERAKEVLVETDNAVRTSQEELELARGEFGERAVEPFVKAFAGARSALTSAFEIRQRLDDEIPETPAQQREMLIEIITSCGRADRELDDRVREFDGLRNLLIDAGDRLDELTRKVVAVSVRVPESEKTLARLREEFPAESIASITDNVTMAGERLKFAEESIDRGRDTVSLPAGKQGPVVTSIRSGESAIAQAQSLLDGVDHAAENIHHAIATLPEAVADLQRGIDASGQFSKQRGDRLAKAKAGAESALATAHTTKTSDPLGAFSAIVEADAELDAALEQAQQTKEEADKAIQRLDREITAAQSQVTAASDFISTRRGAVGADARTRLTEAQRHLDAARQLSKSEPDKAFQHARAATNLATRALSAARNDVQRWESTQSPRRGGGSGTAGAVLGGILIDSMIRGGMRGGRRGSFGGGFGGGGFGGGPGSFGGPSSSGRTGGGGRF
ncbi:TPM domain-containing protein [Rhodococcus sp. NPDC058521]|uniref:TPM domain-containing protein n=1 Tax=Rhodococcus sp. NPDC058521 TaxID=3346536 RepID=UPI00364ED029